MGDMNIEPCPMCGTEQSVDLGSTGRGADGREMFYHVCRKDECGFSGPGSPEFDTYIDAWNTFSLWWMDGGGAETANRILTKMEEGRYKRRAGRTRRSVKRKRRIT